jgi:large subunit ribosomal protein L29
MIKAKELRELSEGEIDKKYQDTLDELFKLKFRHGTRQIENTAKLKEMRKDIARIKTIMTEKRHLEN